jgi:hypothetical protein
VEHELKFLIEANVVGFLEWTEIPFQLERKHDYRRLRLDPWFRRKDDRRGR